MLYIKKPKPFQVITFEEVVEAGLKDPNANIVDGVPWAFHFLGHAVTHENDEKYLINTIPFTNKDAIIPQGVGFSIISLEMLELNYQKYNG